MCKNVLSIFFKKVEFTASKNCIQRIVVKKVKGKRHTERERERERERDRERKSLFESEYLRR